MDTHSDAVNVLSKNRHNLADMISGSADGEIVFWNLPSRKPLYIVNAHPLSVRGLTFANNRILAADTVFVSTGDDKKVHIWSLAGIKKEYEKVMEEFNAEAVVPGQAKSIFKNYQTRATFTSKHMLYGIDHSYGEDKFVTAGSVV
jgi:WD40 repeat protein